MSDDDLMTVATFPIPPAAQIARNALEAAGVRAVVTDETVVAMDWLLGPAVGGIKVQVRAADADRAVEALEAKFGEDGEGFADVIPDADEPDEPTEDQPPDVPDNDPSLPAVAEPVPAETERERYARRAFFAAWLGLGFMPLTFYALYQLLNAAFGPGPLNGRGRFNLFVSAGVVLTGWILWAWLSMYGWWGLFPVPAWGVGGV